MGPLPLPLPLYNIVHSSCAVYSPQKTKRSKSSTQEQLEERDERIRHLEAVNITLKQTNDDLNEEVAELRRQLNEQAEKVKRTNYTIVIQAVDTD